MLTKNEGIYFILNKIRDIRIALFKAEMDSLFPLPVNIVSPIKTDCDGNIWFFTSCNGPFAKIIDKKFYGTLEFYRKGKDCRLLISGKASVDESNESFNYSLNSKTEFMVLIKFKMLKAEYFENKYVTCVSFKDKITDFVTELFFPHSHRKFSFPETA